MPRSLNYDVFIAEPIPQNVSALVPNGDKRVFSPLSITLIYGDREAILVDPPMTIEQTKAVGDWVAASSKQLSYIFATHGHGDHWFGGAALAERFGARVVATAGTIAQMKINVAMREQFWDALFPGQIPDTSVTATVPPGLVLDLEGHRLSIVEVGHSDTDDTSVLHVPDLELVVAGDVVYNGVHQFLREAGGEGIRAWLRAVDAVAALHPRLIVAGHKDKALNDDASRIIAETRQYLEVAEQLLPRCDSALQFFDAMLERFPERLNASALWGSATALYAAHD